MPHGIHEASTSKVIDTTYNNQTVNARDSGEFMTADLIGTFSKPSNMNAFTNNLEKSDEKVWEDIKKDDSPDRAVSNGGG